MLLEGMELRHAEMHSDPLARADFNAGVAQLVEHYLAKVDVEDSSSFTRSILPG